MNRRKFLAFLGLAPVAAIAVKAVIPPYSVNNATYEKSINNALRENSDKTYPLKCVTGEEFMQENQ